MSYRADDPEALEALLAEWGAPASLRQALLDSGYATLGALAFAVPASPANAQETFIMNVLGLDPADPAALMLPEAACLRRLLAVASSLQLPGLASVSASSTPPPATSASKLTAAEVLSLRRTFQQRYSAELLTPDTMPSVEFLSAVKHAHASGDSVWIPWQLRATESDALSWQDSRRPRTDRQLLRHFLESEEDLPGPTAFIPSGGPAEPTVRRALSVFATALSMLQIVHLLVVRRFNDKFLHHALSVPSDPSLRGPSLQEILAADRSVWQAVHTLMRENDWTLSDCLNEIAFCRQDIPSCLQPRPRAQHASHSRIALDAPVDVPPPPAGARKRKRTKGSGKVWTPLPMQRLKPSLPLSDRLPRISTSPGSSRSMARRSACVLPWVVVATPIASLLMSVRSRWQIASPVAKSIQPWNTKKPSID